MPIPPPSDKWLEERYPDFDPVLDGFPTPRARWEFEQRIFEAENTAFEANPRGPGRPPGRSKEVLEREAAAAAARDAASKNLAAAIALKFPPPATFTAASVIEASYADRPLLDALRALIYSPKKRGLHPPALTNWLAAVPGDPESGDPYFLLNSPGTYRVASNPKPNSDAEPSPQPLGTPSDAVVNRRAAQAAAVDALAAALADAFPVGGESETFSPSDVIDAAVAGNPPAVADAFAELERTTFAPYGRTLDDAALANWFRRGPIGSLGYLPFERSGPNGAERYRAVRRPTAVTPADPA